MSIKNILRKAAELVVELPEEEPSAAASAPMMKQSESQAAPVATKSVEQIVRETPGPNLDEISIPEDTNPVPKAPAGQVDFSAVYAKAGLTPAAFTAEQAHEVISSLPADLPIEAKRATVQATLHTMGKAMGVNTESVVADAGRKIAALSAYEDILTHQASTYVAQLEAKIGELQSQIGSLQSEIAQTKTMLESAIGTCDAESERLDDVLEFLTLDQSPSRNA